MCLGDIGSFKHFFFFTHLRTNVNVQPEANRGTMVFEDGSNY